jgi:DNA polymerase-1
MGLPVIDLTDTKQPATGAETIEKLINHTNEPSYKALLSALIEYGKVTKILSTFIPAFEGAVGKDDSDTVWLHGSFNLGGTVSGRLSSSDPNLQNIPAGSKYGKLIKSCFCAPVGWLFCGADFNSLEDYISALTTKDPNKLKVYMGHEVFELTVNGVTQTIRDDAIISYDGKTFTGKEFHDTYCVL